MAKIPFHAVSGFDGSSQTITNVADPVNIQDAATKNSSSNATNLTSGTLAVSRFASENQRLTTWNTVVPMNVSHQYYDVCRSSTTIIS